MPFICPVFYSSQSISHTSSHLSLTIAVGEDSKGVHELHSIDKETIFLQLTKVVNARARMQSGTSDSKSQVFSTPSFLVQIRRALFRIVKKWKQRKRPSTVNG